MQSQLTSPARLALEAHITSVKKMVTRMGVQKRLFISYAWYVDEGQKKELHERLCLLKSDLVNAGASVVLDVENMQGDIDVCIRIISPLISQFPLPFHMT